MAGKGGLRSWETAMANYIPLNLLPILVFTQGFCLGCFALLPHIWLHKPRNHNMNMYDANTRQILPPFLSPFLRYNCCHAFVIVDDLRAIVGHGLCHLQIFLLCHACPY
ncbi:hypothetical protein ABKN59_003686 [Abortiporus biennis]